MAGSTGSPVSTGPSRPSYRALLRHREFAGLAAAQLVSVLGDQIGAVALAVLLYQRTGSPLWPGLVLAATYLPELVGGPLLAALADALPRRNVLIGSDVIRMGLALVLALTGLPALVVVGVWAVVALAASPFAAARSATLPLLLEGDDYGAGIGLITALAAAAQVGGFAFGGLLVSLSSARSGLVVDAATFAVSALLVVRCLRPRPPVVTTGVRAASLAREGILVIARDPLLRRVIGVSALAVAVGVLPEAMAVPLAGRHGAELAGVLLAVNSCGILIGDLWVGRAGSVLGPRLIMPLALLTAGPFVALAWHVPVALLLVVMVLSGLGFAGQVPANVLVGRHVPDELRGRVMGIAGTVIYAAQGFGLLAVGLLATAVGSGPALALLAGAGVLALLVLAPGLSVVVGMWQPVTRERTSRHRAPVRV